MCKDIVHNNAELQNETPTDCATLEFLLDKMSITKKKNINF